MPLNTIMLVDDEPRLLAGIRRRLSSHFDIVTFERGADAIKYLSKPHKVKVIIADMQMPEMNGVELLKKVHEVDPKIRRLMLTGNSDQETAMAAINEGKVFRFIRKPCETGELKTIINQALEDYEFKNTDLQDLVDAPKESPSQVNIQKKFLSVVNDELRTPLAQIITMSEVINRDADNIDNKRLSSFLTQINKSGLFALQQVDRILEYTRLHSENEDAALASQCDIIEVFNRAMASAYTQAKEKMVTLSLESVRKKADVRAPHHSSELMVREIIENAIKFSPFGGHVNIILKFDRERIAARISNSGTESIPAYGDWKKDLSVNPFQFQNMELDKSHKGIGLGLSIVQAIAQKYDINLDFKPAYGGGAAVILVFQRPDALAATPSLKESA